MSFLKITDPSKRDAMIKDYLATKKNIRSNLLSQRAGKMETQSELTKFFKPITETQKATANEITEELKPIKEGIEKLPQAIMFPAFPSIELSKEDILRLGSTAVSSLKRYLTKEGADKTYGIYDKDGKFYIGNKEVGIEDNNIIVDNEEYQGTKGLWELVVSKDPNRDIYIILLITKIIESYWYKLMLCNPKKIQTNQKAIKELNGKMWLKVFGKGIRKQKEKELPLLFLKILTHC